MTTAVESLPWFGDPCDVIVAADIGPGLLLARRIDAARPPWMRRAACRGMPTATFFPSRGESSVEARAICAECPVVDDCRQWALGHDDHGIAAGMSGRQRRRLRAERSRGAV